MSNTENKTGELPIYLLGETPLSLYLAFRFQKAGENPVIIAPQQENRTDTITATIKEAQGLKKYKFSCPTTAYALSPAKLLIITSPLISFKSELLRISPRNFATVPTIVFSLLHDISIAQTLLGKPLIKGYVDGWLQNDNQTVSTLGDTPQICLVKNYDCLEACLSALSLLKRTGLECQMTENGPQAFWEHFSVQLLGSMLSADYQQNIFTIAKSKEKQREIEILATELADLAHSEGAVLNPQNLTQTLFNAPLHYSFPTQNIDSAAISELNQHYRTLIKLSAAAKLRLPKLNRLMKEIYFRINSL